MIDSARSTPIGRFVASLRPKPRVPPLTLPDPTAAGDPELALAKPPAAAPKLPAKFPETPWKKKSPAGSAHP